MQADAATWLEPGRDTILIVDSATGGLGILRRVLHWAQGYQVVYVADTAHHPFGLKSSAHIEALVRSWFVVARVLPAPVRALVVACNTASIAAQAIMPTLADGAGIQAVTMLTGMRALAEAHADQIAGRRIGLMGTRLTIEAGVYQPILMRREPRRVIEIVATATEQAVSYGLINSGAGASAARRELEHYARLVGSPEAVVLGCTCYEFAAAPIRAAFGEQVALLNPADYVAEEVRRLLGIAPTQQPASHAPILLNTGGPEWEATLSLSAEHILGQAVRVHSIDLLRDIDPALSSR